MKIHTRETKFNKDMVIYFVKLDFYNSFETKKLKFIRMFYCTKNNYDLF